jgi:hypothetical protein
MQKLGDGHYNYNFYDYHKKPILFFHEFMNYIFKLLIRKNNYKILSVQEGIL